MQHMFELAKDFLRTVHSFSPNNAKTGLVSQTTIGGRKVVINMFNTRKLLVQGRTAQDGKKSTFRALSDYLSEFSESDEPSNPEPRTSTPRKTPRKYKTSTPQFIIPEPKNHQRKSFLGSLTSKLKSFVEMEPIRGRPVVLTLHQTAMNMQEEK